MLERMWINQPSTLQPLHHLHGVNVLAQYYYRHGIARIYFLSGNVINMEVPNTILDEGWKLK